MRGLNRIGVMLLIIASTGREAFTEPIEKKAESVSDEKIPEKIEKYFERADAHREMTKTMLEGDIKDLEIKIFNSVGQEKVPYRATLKSQKAALNDLNKKKYVAFIPPHPEVGDIGGLRFQEIEVVIDETTVVVNYLQPNARILRNGGLSPFDYRIIESSATREHVVVTGFNHARAKLKRGNAFDNHGYFRVTAFSDTPRKLANDPSLKGFKTIPYMIVEPVKDEEVDKYRKAYDAKKEAEKRAAKPDS